jgi:Spy/CpxP family protein refolding chaperone
MNPKNLAKSIAIGMLAAPLAAMAFGPPGNGPDACAPMQKMQQGVVPSPMGISPAYPVPGAMPLPPHLRHLDLTEAQQDKLFALMHAQAPARHEQSRAAAQALQDLHRLVAANRYDPAAARALAEKHGKAVAELALLHAQLDARLRGLLTTEQRGTLDAAGARHETRRDGGARRP